MPTSEPPNVDFGSPVIFFDTNPEEQESYLYSFWSSLKSSLTIAWTGVVPPFHEPGKLRLVFWTSDGNQGIKDYELHEYELVREVWEKLFNTSDVKRALVTGYSGQNPYITNYGASRTWVDAVERKKRQERNNERMENSRQQRSGKAVDIEGLIKQAEEVEIDADTRRNTVTNINKGGKERLVDV